MKRALLLFTALTVFLFTTNAQLKKDGTPDMRYSANKQTYGTTYSTPNSTYGTSSGVRYQSGYIRDNGIYVEPYFKTNSNETNWDNFSTKGNTNPYTGTSGSRALDYSPEAYNYGSGQTIYTGSRGGQYYYNSSGNKTYVPKRN